MNNMRYTIDTTDNGYILTAKVLPDTYCGKYVFHDLQSLFDKLDQLEAEQGRIQ